MEDITLILFAIALLLSTFALITTFVTVPLLQDKMPEKRFKFIKGLKDVLSTLVTTIMIVSSFLGVLSQINTFGPFDIILSAPNTYEIASGENIYFFITSTSKIDRNNMSIEQHIKLPDGLSAYVEVFDYIDFQVLCLRDVTAAVGEYSITLQKGAIKDLSGKKSDEITSVNFRVLPTGTKSSATKMTVSSPALASVPFGGNQGLFITYPNTIYKVILTAQHTGLDDFKGNKAIVQLDDYSYLLVIYNVEGGGPQNKVHFGEGTAIFEDFEMINAEISLPFKIVTE